VSSAQWWAIGKFVARRVMAKGVLVSRQP